MPTKRPVFKITPRVPTVPISTPGRSVVAPPAPTYGADALLQLLPGIAPTGAQALLQNPDPAMMQQQAALPGVLQTLATVLGGGNNVGGAAPAEATGAAGVETGRPFAAAPASPGYNFNYVDYPTPPEPIAVPMRDRANEERLRNAAFTAASFAPLFSLGGGSTAFAGNLFNQLAAGGIQGAQAGSDRAFAQDLQNYQLTSEQQQQEYARRRQMAVDTNAGIDRRNNIVDRITDNARQEEIAQDNKAIREEQNSIRREGLEMRDRQAEATRKTRERVALIARAERLTPEAEASLAESLRESISLGLTGDDLFRDMSEKERRAAEETAFRNDINLYGINTRAEVQREGQATNRYVAELNNSTRRFGIEVGYEVAGMRVGSAQDIAAAQIASRQWQTTFNAQSRDSLLRTRVSLSANSPAAKELSTLNARQKQIGDAIFRVQKNIEDSHKTYKSDKQAGAEFRAGQLVELEDFIAQRDAVETEIVNLKARAIQDGSGTVVSSSTETTTSTGSTTRTAPTAPPPVPAFNRPGTAPSARPNPVGFAPRRDPLAFVGTPTNKMSGGGRVACADGVCKVLEGIGVPKRAIPKTSSVYEFTQKINKPGSGWVPVDPSQTQSGDVVAYTGNGPSRYKGFKVGHIVVADGRGGSVGNKKQPDGTYAMDNQGIPLRDPNIRAWRYTGEGQVEVDERPTPRPNPVPGRIAPTTAVTAAQRTAPVNAPPKTVPPPKPKRIVEVAPGVMKPPGGGLFYVTPRGTYAGTKADAELEWDKAGMRPPWARKPLPREQQRFVDFFKNVAKPAQRVTSTGFAWRPK